MTLADADALLSRIAQGDRQAFTRFYTDYSGRVRALLTLKGSLSHELNDDLVQEVFLSVWLKADGFDPSRGSAEAWLHAIAKNKLFDHWRKMQRIPEEYDLAPDCIGAHGDADARLAAETAMGKMANEDQKLFQLVYLEGLTMRQCSEALGVPEGTIKWRIRRIVKVFRGRLENPELA